MFDYASLDNLVIEPRIYCTLTFDDVNYDVIHFRYHGMVYRHGKLKV